MKITKRILRNIRRSWIMRMVLAACGILLLAWLVLWAMKAPVPYGKGILLSLAVLACAALIGWIIGLEQAAVVRRRIREMGSDLDQCVMVRAGDGLYYGETWMVWHQRESWLFWRRDQVNEIRVPAHNRIGNRAVVTVSSLRGRHNETIRLNNTTMAVLAALERWPQG